MSDAGYDGVFIVGAGQTLYEKQTTKSVHRLLWEATSSGLRAGGISPKRVDGLAVTSLGLHPDNAASLAEHFGFECRWLFQGVYGGASGPISLMHAARAIQAGDANVVVCVAAYVYSMASHLGTERNAGQRDYMIPFGWGAQN